MTGRDRIATGSFGQWQNALPPHNLLRVTDIPLAGLQSRLTRVLAVRYRIDRFLGPGGMGSACAAEHKSLHRPVAIRNTAVAILCYPGLTRGRAHALVSHSAR